MTVAQFIKKYNGKRICDANGNYCGECVSAAKKWILENHWPYRHGNAQDWNYGDKDYTWIKNTLTNHPSTGDLIVYKYPPYGHIALVISANTLTVKVFQQNSPLKSPCHTSTKTYISCAGWLHKR